MGGVSEMAKDKLVCVSEYRSIHPLLLINRKAKDRKRKKAKIQEWLKKNGRTAKQVKKKREKNDRNSRFYS